MTTPTWPALLTYPQHVGYATRTTLDALESLLPAPACEDRYLTVSRWLDAAVEAGLLTSVERYRLRTDIAGNL